MVQQTRVCQEDSLLHLSIIFVLNQQKKEMALDMGVFRLINKKAIVAFQHTKALATGAHPLRSSSMPTRVC